jgi:hypothetical protein
MKPPSFATYVLKLWGAKVADVPTSDKEESDLLASLVDCRVLIEEKTKFDDAAYLAQRAQQLSSGAIHLASTPLVRNNRLSKIVTKAASQLRSSSDREHDFRVVWFTATGVDAEAKYYQFMATLYGSTRIIELDNQKLRHCYFFRNSDFHRCADVLDGAVVAHIIGNSLSAKLCLNPLSVRWEALRDSAFARPFGTAIEDPVESESAGIAFVVDADIDRKDEGAVLRFLQQKYSTRPLMKMDMGFTSATVSIPR